MTEQSQQRIMLAGFRLLAKETHDGRFLIQYRDRSLFGQYGYDAWQTMASYTTRQERDLALATLLHNDVWSIEV